LFVIEKEFEWFVLFTMNTYNSSAQVCQLKLKTTIIIDASNDAVYAFDVRGN
jgi:hypothetical protein